MPEVLGPMTPSGQITHSAETIAEVSAAMDAVTADLVEPVRIAAEVAEQEAASEPEEKVPVEVQLIRRLEDMRGVTGQKRTELIRSVRDIVVGMLRKRGEDVTAEMLAGVWGDNDLKRELAATLRDIIKHPQSGSKH